MENQGATDLAGVISCYVDSAITNGVVGDSNQVRALINNVNNQTLMALYTIPAGKTGYMSSFFAAIAGAKKTADYKIELFSRPNGKVFQTKHISTLQDGGTTHWNHIFQVPEKFVEKTDITMKVTILTAGVTAAAIGAGFDLILINN